MTGEADLNEAEQLVLAVFTESCAAMKAIELAALCARQMIGHGMSADSLVAAIYSLVRKLRIIEIEYPDPQIPDRVKSFLLPATTEGFRVNGISAFTMARTDSGLVIDFQTDTHHDR